ncbi:hypothetical protein SUGI_0824440 [Cryptomeria japonica]|nr:hypothetical protein SUGI_0824440 [Cryptomeria japonica]
MAYFGRVSCVNCENTLNMQLRNLFRTKDYVYDSVRGLVGITLNFDRHWCDAMVLEAILLPLVDIIDSGECVVELLAGLIKPFIADSVANAILKEGNEDGEDREDSAEDEESVDSDTIREMAHREVWKEERERLNTFRENAWEIFRCVVFNGNMEPFRRVTEFDDWWLPENSTRNAICIGEFNAVIYQAIGGQESTIAVGTTTTAEPFEDKGVQNEFYLKLLDLRGDNIVFRDYRGEVPKGSAEIFFRKVKFWKGDDGEEAPPIFNVDGVNYLHVKVAGLLFVATTRVNVSPALVLELLQRIARVIKDYLGILNEDSLRKNFVLVYELLDEVIDFGYPQTTSTEVLKSFIFNEPIVVDAGRLPSLGPASLFMQGSKRMPGTAVTKSVVANEAGGRKREEVFVDIIEKISVTFSSSGYILTSEIDGTIQMKSYLTGNPEIRLALNEDLSIGRSGHSSYDYSSSAGAGMVVLDDCNFHESVRLDNFDLDRTLTLVPPDGEFPVMNYRMTQEFKPPFRVNSLIEEAGAFKAEVMLKVRADFSNTITANTVALHMPLPKYTTRVSFELEPGATGQTTDFKEGNKMLEWGLRKIVGGAEHTLRAKLTFSQDTNMNITKESGPVSMTFTIPMYSASRLQVRYLQIVKKSRTYNPYRWVRYVTHANSYVIRI